MRVLTMVKNSYVKCKYFKYIFTLLLNRDQLILIFDCLILFLCLLQKITNIAFFVSSFAFGCR